MNRPFWTRIESGGILRSFLREDYLGDDGVGALKFYAEGAAQRFNKRAGESKAKPSMFPRMVRQISAPERFGKACHFIRTEPRGRAIADDDGRERAGILCFNLNGRSSRRIFRSVEQ